MPAPDPASVERRVRETPVLLALEHQPQFAIEPSPDENRRPGEASPVSEAVKRCLHAGWAQIDHGKHCDARIQLTATGPIEVAVRTEQTRRRPTWH
jgi:hypothetical protein